MSMASTAAAAYRRPLFDADDALFGRCLATSACVAAVLLIAVRLIPAPPPRPVTHVQQLPQRFARLILEPAKPVTLTPPPRPALPAAERVTAKPEPAGGGGGGGGEPEARPTHKPVPAAGAPAGNRQVETMHSLATGSGDAGRARAQAEVGAQLAGTSSSLKSALAGLTASLGVTSSAAGGTVARGGRSRGIRAARGAGELGSLGGAGAVLPGGAGSGAAGDLGGSAVAGSLVSIGELAAGPGWGTGSGAGVGTGSGGGIGSGTGTGVGAGHGAGDGAAPGVYRSNASLLAVIQRYSAGIQYCYGNELKRDPTLRGKLVVAITVAPSGEVTEANVVQNTTGSQRLAACALSQVRDWRFPAVTGGATTFQAPFVFTPPN